MVPPAHVIHRVPPSPFAYGKTSYADEGLAALGPVTGGISDIFSVDTAKVLFSKPALIGMGVCLGAGLLLGAGIAFSVRLSPVGVVLGR